MMKPLMRILALAACLAGAAQAQTNLQINTPAVTQLKAALHEHFQELKPLLVAGAVGLARDGTMQLRDPALVPLAQRGSVNALLTRENADRDALYREIARANGHPEWTDEIRQTFAQRFIDRAPAGWWVQDSSGQWVKK
jgi:uncharacterized protein YdbL (DUF1318 family)